MLLKFTVKINLVLPLEGHKCEKFALEKSKT